MRVIEPNTVDAIRVPACWPHAKFDETKAKRNRTVDACLERNFPISVEAFQFSFNILTI